MDISGVDYQEAKYNSVKEEVSNLLKMAGFNPADVPMVPCSSFNGENLYEKSSNMSWYSGPTLFECIDGIQMPPKPTDRPLVYPFRTFTRSAVSVQCLLVRLRLVFYTLEDSCIQPKPEVC
ncbi:MAG: hypothetical protein Ct9H90mP16_06550 [Candidatus Poseidoniales archaeon]|nr:MAG: hypothetical protein Ct9H90mP16_06550 [Candidatus Poseidoniales archaeon]